jgi:Peptidase_C39 like family
MKLLHAIGLLTLAGLLNSCCCPNHARKSGGGALASSSVTPIVPTEQENTAGSRFIILGPQNPLPVVPRKQQGFYSCWSTSAEMIMDYLGRHVTQCEQASRPGDSELWCCEGQGELKYHTLGCDEPGYPDFERWGFEVNRAPPPPFLDWGQVMNEIDNGRPFAFSWIRNDLNNPGSPVSHMLVVVGYTQSGGPETRKLFCLNSRAFAVADEIMVPFSDYRGSPPPTGIANTGIPGYTHLSDYFGIQPASPLATNP